MKDRFEKEGASPMPMSRADFARLMAEETVRWASVAKETGIKVD
jgi:tripartite-type tricarboxylate transporter receptor subunit TctC